VTREDPQRTMARRNRPARPHLAVRHPHRRLARLRGHRVALVALLAVLGPGLLAGLSDDDPAGIATYSILGADYGYELLWVLALSTAALVVFHELAARVGVVTGKGLMRLVRERYGRRAAALALSALVLANVGTICAELAGVAAGMQVLAGTSRYLAVPVAAVAVAVLVLRGSFGRVEHVLLALGAIFVTYIVSGFMAHPDWGATARGLVVPTLPGSRHGLLVVVATLGTTLAPWGLAFMQSYAVDKRLTVRELGYERVDVISGAVLTGIIGLFVVVACAATLHAHGLHVDDARDARPRARAARRQRGHNPVRARPRRRRPARGGGRAAVDRLLGGGGVRAARRPQRLAARGARLLRRLRREHRRGGGGRADPRRAADLDPVPHTGAQRRPAARHPAVPARARARPRADGRAPARPRRLARDGRRDRIRCRFGRGAARAERRAVNDAASVDGATVVT
jgi:hypothetical protein